METQGGEGLCYGTGHLYGGSRTKTVSVSQWDDVGSLMPGIIYIQCPACSPSSVVVPKYENMNHYSFVCKLSYTFEHHHISTYFQVESDDDSGDTLFSLIRILLN